MLSGLTASATNEFFEVALGGMITLTAAVVFLGLSHKGATALVTVICIAGNLFVLWFSKGLAALDTLDFWVGTFMIFVVAGTQIICFAWVFGVDRGLEEAHRGGGDADRGVVYAWGVILLTIATLMIVTAIGARRWRAAGLDIDGRKPPADEERQGRVEPAVFGGTP